MHVLSSVDAVGGVWTYALELARALPDVRFSFAQMGPRPSNAQRSEVAALPNVEQFESDFKLEWQAEPWEDVDRSGEWLLELQRELRPDLVHLNGFSHGALPFEVPKIVVAHSCVLSWWEAVKDESPPRDWREYARRVEFGLNLADAIVAPTAAFGHEITRTYNLSRAVQTIHNGAAPFQTPAQSREPFVLCAGRAWDEAKNFAVLEETAARVPVRLAGEAGDFCAPNIELLGRLERAQLETLLARAAVFAHPALYEPFGLGVLEAAQAGLALVVSDIPTMRELWDGAAVFCDPREANDWTQALELLMNQKSERLELGERAKERAQKYSRESFGQGYRALYEQLVSSRKPDALVAQLKGS
jgi:glycogen(starch) synthase